MAVVRGAIRNYERARQQLDFSGLKFGQITPTDMDGWFEYQNKCFVFFEFKYGRKWTLQQWQGKVFGQKLALERIADNMTRPTLLILAQHLHPPHEDVDAANASIVAYRVNGAWFEPSVPVAVDSCVEWFLRLHGYEGVG